MNTIIMMLFGAGLGAGVLLLGRSLRPVSQPIGDVFDAVQSEGTGYAETRDDTEGASPTDLLRRIGVSITLSTSDEAQLRKNLAVTGSTLEQHALVKAGAPAATILLVYLAWGALNLVGVSLGVATITLAALAFASAAFIVPDIRLRTRAKERRAGFRHALSAYLDLVTIIMSGGGGLLTALQSAAEAGDGWAFAELRGALDRARLSNRTPWSQLGVLADRFDIAELRDLVSAAELSGSEGSQIVSSVATKADVLRSRLSSEVEATAEAMTEQMLLPVGLILIALFFFLGFAVFQQLGGNPGDALDEQTFDLLKLSLSARL